MNRTRLLRELFDEFFRAQNRSLKLYDDIVQFISTRRVVSKTQGDGTTVIDVTKYKKVVQLLRKGYPPEYITSKAYFYGYSFWVKPGVYIPNPFTEKLVDYVLTEARRVLAQGQPVTILDIGTGSGAVALSVVKELGEGGLRRVEVIATDKSAQAIEVARYNARRLGVAGSVAFYVADVAFIEGNAILPRYQNVIIASNKPYLPKDVFTRLPRHVKLQGKLALLRSRDFDSKFKAYVNLLRNKGYRVTTVVETFRNRKPVSAKVVVRRYNVDYEA